MNHRKNLSNQETISSGTQILKIVGGVMAIFAASQISIPLTPVPMTLQTFAMLLIGLTYSPREAFASIGLWITLGALGFPVFAGYSGGMGIFLRPTGGYFAGLWLAPVVMAWARETGKFRGIFSLSVLAIGGQVILFALGLAWLSRFVGWELAISLGFMPFALWNALKTVLAVFCARALLSKKVSSF